jgi:transcriptional regulator with XRE-family HTH domain
MATIAETFGSNLQRIRKQQGITQQQLGAFTRISTSFIGEMERGLKSPNLEAVVAIARALRVPIADLVEGLNPTPQQ